MIPKLSRFGGILRSWRRRGVGSVEMEDLEDLTWDWPAVLEVSTLTSETYR